MINGLTSLEKMKSINPDSIQSVNVLKGDAAKALYGEPGKNGVVLIKSKEKPSDDTAIKQINTSDSIFETVEMGAWFPKGDEGWMRFIHKNLRTNVPRKNHAPAGSYKVSVSFFVEKDGTISELSIDENPGYGAAEELVRVLKKSPKWVPGQQNGKIVKCRKRQTIIFQVTEE